jgi:hypothetical protein
MWKEAVRACCNVLFWNSPEVSGVFFSAIAVCMENSGLKHGLETSYPDCGVLPFFSP